MLQMKKNGNVFLFQLFLMFRETLFLLCESFTKIMKKKTRNSQSAIDEMIIITIIIIIIII